jgi:hypothetical protein
MVYRRCLPSYESWDQILQGESCYEKKIIIIIIIIYEKNIWNIYRSSFISS